jgi:hypothetical protein
MLPKILDVLNNTVHRAIIGNRTDGTNHVILDRLKGWVHVLSTFPHQPVQCDAAIPSTVTVDVPTVRTHLPAMSDVVTSLLNVFAASRVQT